MNCDDALILIYDFIDGELPYSDRPALQEHLSACSDCHARAGAIEEFDNYLKANIIVEPAPILAENIVTALQKEHQEYGLIRPLSTRAIIFRMSGIAAGLAAMVYLFIKLPVIKLPGAASSFSSLSEQVIRFNPQMQSNSMVNSLSSVNVKAFGEQLLNLMSHIRYSFAGAFTINSSLIILMVIAQIGISYFLVNRDRRLEGEKE